ncbi:MAG: hypothetical protein RB296_06050 [Acidobacteriota bacterium]|nr:hypothetical protein [Acidobacteriota bacterium]
MKKLVFAFVAVSLACIPLTAQAVKAIKMPIKATTVQVLQPDAATTWIPGQNVSVRWIPLRPLAMSKATVSIYLFPAFPSLTKPVQILLAGDVRDTGIWSGVLTGKDRISEGQFRVSVIRNGEKGISAAFRVLKSPPRPDLVGSFDYVSPSYEPSDGTFMGWNVSFTFTNLQHALAPIASGATLWWRIESQADPAVFFEQQITGVELGQLHAEGHVQVYWGLDQDTRMPLPWKLTIDSKGHIAERDEANNVTIHH